MIASHASDRYSVRTSVQLTQRQRQALARLSERHDRSVSYLIREAIDNLILRYDAETSAGERHA